MSYTFEKVTVKKWEVTGIYKDYIKYEEDFKNQMPNLKCEICGTKIQTGEMINLAYVKGRKNHFVCNTCSDKAAENGVEISYKKTEPPMPKFD